MLIEDREDFGETSQGLLEPGLLVACWFDDMWRRAEILTVCDSENNESTVQYYKVSKTFLDLIDKYFYLLDTNEHGRINVWYYSNP